MCITIISTVHPSYPLIVLNNRDEYLHRPTAPASWLPSSKSGDSKKANVLSPRDLARPERGSWIGVTREGRIAVLTNYRENPNVEKKLKGLEDFSTSIPIYQQSRGILPKSFLESPSDVSTTDFAKTLVQSGNAASTGGFTLVCGEMRGRSPLAIVSNRSQIKENLERVENEDGDLIGSSDDQGVFWILGKHEQLERRSTVAFSNVAFSDRSWPKVINGEQIAEEVLARSIYAKDDEDALAQRLFRDVLSVDTLPRVDEENEQIELLKQSIFVPLICRDDKAKIRETHGKSASKVDTQEETAHEDLKTKQGELPTYLRGAYGTQTQTIIMLHESGQVAYFERVLYDSDARPIPVEQRDHIHRFKLEN